MKCTLAHSSDYMRVDYMRIYVSSRVAADFATLPLRVVYRAGVGGGRLGATVFLYSVSADAVGNEVDVACAFSAGSTLRKLTTLADMLANFFPSMFHRGYDRGSVDSV